MAAADGIAPIDEPRQQWVDKLPCAHIFRFFLHPVDRDARFIGPQRRFEIALVHPAHDVGPGQDDEAGPIAGQVADPVGEKDCRPAADSAGQGRTDLDRIKAIAPLNDVKWSQLGGSINDASCLNKTEIYGVVDVRSVDDIAKTLAFARDNKLEAHARKLSIGRTITFVPMPTRE